jgi:hypothetical protein
MLEVETMAAMIADAAKRKRARNAVLRRQTELAFTGPLGLVACAKGILLARSPESPMRWPPSSAANESWPHEQFCQSAFDASKAVVARGTPRAAMSDLSHSRRFRDVRHMSALLPTTEVQWGAKRSTWSGMQRQRRN